MNKYKLCISLAGLTLGSLATMNCIIEPVSAQEPQIDIPSLSESFSTNATDLLADDRLAQGIDNLDKFCTNFPYNSQCRDRQSDLNQTETQPEEVQPEVPSEPTTKKETSRRQRISSKSGWAIVPEFSTLGLGGSVVKKIIPQINGRVGVNAFGLNFDIENSGLTYEGDLNLFNVSTILDLHPIEKLGFKLSGGLVFSSNNVKGTANVSEETVIELGDNESINASNLASVDADVDITNSVSPYLGIGWGNAVAKNKGLGFWFNAGVMFSGSPSVSVTPNFIEGVPESIQQDIEEAAEEEEQEINDEADVISIYPVVSLGLSYQF